MHNVRGTCIQVCIPNWSLPCRVLNCCWRMKERMKRMIDVIEEHCHCKPHSLHRHRYEPPSDIIGFAWKLVNNCPTSYTVHIFLRIGSWSGATYETTFQKKAEYVNPLFSRLWQPGLHLYLFSLIKSAAFPATYLQLHTSCNIMN